MQPVNDGRTLAEQLYDAQHQRKYASIAPSLRAAPAPAPKPVADPDAPFAPKGADMSRPIPPVPQGMNLARTAFDYDRWQWVESWNQAARDEARAARNRAHRTAVQAQRVQS